MAAMAGGRPVAQGPPLLAWACGAIALLVALALWQGHGFFDYSDGVYSLSAREVLEGHRLYRDFAGAQPPTLYYLGAGALAVHDTPGAVRIAMAACEAALSLLVLIAVWRLTAHRWAALAGGLLALLTPWALAKHAQLLPETVGAPVVLGAALLASRERGAVAAGLLTALAASLKLPLALAGLGAVLVSRGRRRGLAAFALAGAIALVLFLVLFGSAGIDSVWRTQLRAGRNSAHYIGALWAQAGWNLLPLAVPAVFAWPLRERFADRELARTLAAALAGSLLLLPTLVKVGSSLTVMVMVEPLALCFAVCGALWLAQTARERAGRPGPAALAAGAATLLGAAQVIGLLAAPGDPPVFNRPLSARAAQRGLTTAQVDHLVGPIRACPSGSRYPGSPYLAFRAHRRPAGGQPDQFLASRLATFRHAVRDEPRKC
jgi:hypothetical protein